MLLPESGLPRRRPVLPLMRTEPPTVLVLAAGLTGTLLHRSSRSPGTALIAHMCSDTVEAFSHNTVAASNENKNSSTAATKATAVPAEFGQAAQQGNREGIGDSHHQLSSRERFPFLPACKVVSMR
jgi:hypothetical protein